MKIWLMIISFYCFNYCACAWVNQTSNNLRNTTTEETSFLNNSSVTNNVVPPKEERREKSLQQGIRAVDFENFTYNWFPKYGEVVIKKKIVLRNGENKEIHVEGPGIKPNGEDYKEYLADVSYADLTGDGKEEAIVTVAVSFYRWTPQCIFIFGEENKKPILLWQYETDVVGRNLDWRGHKVKDGNLIIEEYDMKYGEPGNCCPLRYFRKTFVWNGEIFEEKKTEIFSNEKQGREFIGYPSDDNE